MLNKKLVVPLAGLSLAALTIFVVLSGGSANTLSKIEDSIDASSLKASPPGGGSSCDKYVYVKQWGRSPFYWLNGKLRHPYGIHVDNSDVIYVADSGNYRIQKFTSNGDFISKWGSKGTGNGKFNFPIGVATNSSGEFVYVLDFTNNNVQKFDASGNFKIAWGRPGSSEGQFSGPRGITVDEFGNVYVIDTGNRRVQKFDADGKFLDMWGSALPPENFQLPTGIDTDIPGYIYTTDSKSGDIKKFDPTTHEILDGYSMGAPTDIRDLAVDDSGDIFFSDIGGVDQVWKFNSDLSFITVMGESGSGDGQFNNPRGVDVDSQGNVYIADEGNNRVQKFRPDCAKIVIRKKFVNEPQQDKDFEFFRNFGGNFYLNANDLEGYIENEIVFPVVPSLPGSFYTITEILRGYGLYRIDCVDPSGGTFVDVASRTASISITGNETVTCTFVNQLID